MDFPSEMGDRIMQVNAIPEFDENQKLESVLVVSHDITERKVIELEIQNIKQKNCRQHQLCQAYSKCHTA